MSPLGLRQATAACACTTSFRPGKENLRRTTSPVCKSALVRTPIPPRLTFKSFGVHVPAIGNQGNVSLQSVPVIAEPAPEDQIARGGQRVNRLFNGRLAFRRRSQRRCGGACRGAWVRS